MSTFAVDFAAISQTQAAAASAQSQTAVHSVGKSSASGSADDSPKARKLRQAAAEFEGMLLSSLWKSMKSSFATPDDEATDPAHDTLDDLGIQTMSNAVAKAGGIGLGKLILKRLEPMLNESHGEHSSASVKLPGGLPISPIE
jgi:Rod binding domain-containing protein